MAKQNIWQCAPIIGMLLYAPTRGFSQLKNELDLTDKNDDVIDVLALS